jgi:hypothetical protein
VPLSDFEWTIASDNDWRQAGGESELRNSSVQPEGQEVSGSTQLLAIVQDQTCNTKIELENLQKLAVKGI